MKKDKSVTDIVASSINPFIRLFDKYNLEKLSVSDRDLKITISAETNQKTQSSVSTDTGTHQEVYRDDVKKINLTEKQGVEEKTDAIEDKSNYTIIKSPIVGTFYSKPSPDAPAFVTEGSVVTPDTTVCIIEAMKMMNEIKAECSGTIAKAIAKDASPVKEDDKLFYIKPS